MRIRLYKSSPIVIFEVIFSKCFFQANKPQGLITDIQGTLAQMNDHADSKLAEGQKLREHLADLQEEKEKGAEEKEDKKKNIIQEGIDFIVRKQMRLNEAGAS